MCGFEELIWECTMCPLFSIYLSNHYRYVCERHQSGPPWRWQEDFVWSSGKEDGKQLTVFIDCSSHQGVCGSYFYPNRHTSFSLVSLSQLWGRKNIISLAMIDMYNKESKAVWNVLDTGEDRDNGVTNVCCTFTAAHEHIRTSFVLRPTILWK